MSETSGEEWKGDVAKPNETGYGMLWRFVDQSPAFTLGVEAGILYERMQRREQTIEATVHGENDEDLQNLANTFDYALELYGLDEEGRWLTAKFTRL